MAKKRWTQKFTQVLSAKSKKRVVVQKKIFLVMAASMLLLHLGLSFWAHNELDRTLRNILSVTSNDMLQVQRTLLKKWFQSERELVQSWASYSELERNVNLINQDAGNASAKQNAMKDVRQFLQDANSELGYLGYMIINRQGDILLSDDSTLHGQTVSPLALSWVAALANNEQLPPLIVESERLLQHQPASFSPAVIPVIVNIQYQGEYVASLIAKLDPTDEFSQLFDVIHFSESIDMFAFDRNGFLVSESNRLELLQQNNLLVNEDVASSILNVRLVEPEGRAGDRPLTYLAGSALKDKKAFGINLNGYRDMLGNNVFGAWIWDESLGYGIGIEIDQAEAEGLVLPLRIVEGAVFVFVGISLLAVVGFAYFNYRLREQVEEMEHLGQYQLLEKIGEGGMGEVYYAKHAMLLRPTAVKLLRKDANEEIITRFRKEVRLTSRLTHPNTVEIYDYGTTDSGRFYYAMEYIEGFNLAELLDHCPIVPASRVIHILIQACGSLREAHEEGLVHRDIKPMNIMLTRRSGFYDQVKVLDFGLVKEHLKDEDDLTATQVLRGTPTYIAPERLVNARCADPSVDIYALAAIAYNLLTGKDLYEATTQMEIMGLAMSTMPERIQSTSAHPIPEPLIDLIMQCLQKDPLDRPADIATVMTTLRKIEATNEWQQQQAKAWWTENQNKLPQRQTFSQESEGVNVS